MTTQNDVLREIEKLVCFYMAQLISDDEFCENVILRMVHADQSNWPEILNATGAIGSEKLQTYCKRIDLADAMPLHEALMVPKLPPEATVYSLPLKWKVARLPGLLRQQRNCVQN